MSALRSLRSKALLGHRQPFLIGHEWSRMVAVRMVATISWENSESLARDSVLPNAVVVPYLSSSRPLVGG